jgi:aquaporin Z
MLIGSSGGVVAVSPLGRLSGAHLNPAVTLGFLLLRKMHGRDAVGYIASQLGGAVLGVLAARSIAPRLCASVHDAVLIPASSLSPGGVAGLEMAVTFVLCGAIFLFVSAKSLMRFTPLAVIGCAGLLNLFDGNLSGFGANPARWWGPAVWHHWWSFAACYALAPLLGAALAVPLPRLIARFGRVSHHPRTGKLFHDPRYRSIFVHDTAPSRPPSASEYPLPSRKGE